MLKKTIALAVALLIITVASANAAAPRYYGKLCNNCGFGQKKEYCVKCGKWAN